MIQPVAYEFFGMTFCPGCALRATKLGMMAAGLPAPADMDEAIAATALTQIERGLPIVVPLATTKPTTECCEACDRPFQTAEESEEVA